RGGKFEAERQKSFDRLKACRPEAEIMGSKKRRTEQRESRPVQREATAFGLAAVVGNVGYQGPMGVLLALHAGFSHRLQKPLVVAFVHSRIRARLVALRGVFELWFTTPRSDPRSKM